MVGQRKPRSPVICCYVHAPDSEEGGEDDKWPLGGSRLDPCALVDLDASIKALGSGAGMTILDARNHSTVSTSGCLREFLSAVKAKALYFNRVCEPRKCSHDREIIEALTQPRVQHQRHHGAYV